ncbi:hypothetical protein ANN_16923 [Periplaneta americana]|uniref:Uncharacterized protein n=1 Tax=Periplaneta americana TaxID=6978 RepID=A0ABQ8SSP3_PERAM|nr:hypothetical protein ANN_16923 [Periplaneta americana]
MEKVTHALYNSADIIRNIKSRRLRWAGHVASMGESRNAYRVLVGRPEGKRPLGRPRRRWEDNIKMDLMEMEYDDRDWIHLAQDRDQWRAYVRAAMNLRNGPEFTQPPIKLSTGSFPGVKGGQSVVPTTPPHSSAEVMESMGLYLHAPQVPSWHVTEIPLPFLQINSGHNVFFGSYAKFDSVKRVQTEFRRRMSKHHAMEGRKWTCTVTDRMRIISIKAWMADAPGVRGGWRPHRDDSKVPRCMSTKLRLRWARHVARMGESRNAYRVLVRRLEGKRPLGRTRRRWEDNIKMDLREVGYDDRDWINLSQIGTDGGFM